MPLLYCWKLGQPSRHRPGIGPLPEGWSKFQRYKPLCYQLSQCGGLRLTREVVQWWTDVRYGGPTLIRRSDRGRHFSVLIPSLAPPHVVRRCSRSRHIRSAPAVCWFNVADVEPISIRRWPDSCHVAVVVYLTLSLLLLLLLPPPPFLILLIASNNNPGSTTPPPPTIAWFECHVEQLEITKNIQSGSSPWRTRKHTIRIGSL